jgi:hypothetical protein
MEMKSSRRLAENDIITRGVTVKIQQVAVHTATTSCITYKPSPCDLENSSNDANGEDE